MLRSLRSSALLFFLLTLCGCQYQPLIVETEYVTERSLASYWVDTPDPFRICPCTGQRIIVSWNFPREYMERHDPHFQLTVRFGNDAEDTVMWPLHRHRSCYTYEAIDDDYWDNDGILTYCLLFIADDEVLHEWYHQLWVEYIDFEPPEDEVYSEV